jgi:hypothetical protein
MVSGGESGGSGARRRLGVARIKEGEARVSPQGAADGGRLWPGRVTEAASGGLETAWAALPRGLRPRRGWRSS